MKFFKYKDLVMHYKKTFGTESGKAVLHDLMKNCHVLGSAFSKDPHEAAFKEGSRNVVLKIMHMLDVDPNKLDEVIKEQASQELF